MSAKNQIKFHYRCIKQKPGTAWFHIKGIARGVLQLNDDVDFDFILLFAVTTSLLIMQVWVARFL